MMKQMAISPKSRLQVGNASKIVSPVSVNPLHEHIASTLPICFPTEEITNFVIGLIMVYIREKTNSLLLKIAKTRRV